MEQVVLVCAPFFSVVRPALGVSLLKSALRERGIASEIRYLNVEFADHIGVSFHESAATGVANTLLVGEWIFSPMVNDDTVPAADEQYRAVLTRLYSPHHLEQLESIRSAAREFVESQAAQLAAGNPSILGFTTSFQQNCASLAIAKRVRQLNPEILICFGGANCEGPMGQALLDSYPQIDYVFSGEADLTFPNFVQQILSGLSCPASDSILSRSHNGDMVTIGAVPSSGGVEDLDALPYPDFSDYFSTLDETAYRARVRPSLVFESSRGCWWGAKKHCRFCGLNGAVMSYRTKSASRVIDEISSSPRTIVSRSSWPQTTS